MNKYSGKKIVWFPEKLKSFVDNEITAPIYVRIKPTNKCNHNCSWCIYKSEFMHDTCNRTDEIPVGKLYDILCDLQRIGTKAITFSGGGEPTIYKGIHEALKTCIDFYLDFSMITNGQYLKGDTGEYLRRANWIRISMDYFDENSFNKARGLPEDKFKEIIQNISCFSRIKNDCDLGVNFIVTKENVNNLEEITKMLKYIGVDNIRFAPLWVKDFQEYHKNIQYDFKRELDSIKKLEDDSFKIYSSYNLDHDVKRSYRKCWMNQVVPVIGADLNVYTCHNGAYDQNHLIGSIKDRKFSELWFSYETKKFFDEFLPLGKCNNMQCAADSKNIFINELVDCYGDDFV